MSIRSINWWIICAGLILIPLGIFHPAQAATLATGPTQEYLFKQGKKLYDRGRPAQAIRVWQKILPDTLYGPVAYILSARGQLRLKHPDRAETLLKEFLSKHPAGPYRNVARDALVEVLSVQGKPQARAMLLSMIRTARGNKRRALVLRAARFERRMGNYAASEKHYRKLYEHYPASVEGLAAADELTRMVFLGKLPPPNFSAREKLQRAGRLYKKGRFDLAAPIYRALLKKNPSDTGIALKLARCLHKNRWNREAVKLCKRIVKKSAPGRNRMEALYLLSLLYWRIDREKEFKETCRQIIEKGPTKLKRKALFNLGAHYLETHRLDRAEAYFNKVLRSGPSRPAMVDALWKTAWIRYRKKEYDGAARGFRQIRTVSRGSAIERPSRYWEARSLLLSGRSGKAESLLKQLVNSSPVDYYGVEAARLLESRGIDVKRESRSKTAFRNLRLSSRHRAVKLVSRAAKLMDNGLHEFALLNLNALPASLKSSPAISFLRAKAAHGAGKYRLAQEILRGKFGDLMENPPHNAPKDFIEIAFPRVHSRTTVRAARRHSVDPYLVWAVIRQESRYDAQAVSPAGALGLMQVTPRATGLVGKRAKVPTKVIERILDPKKNLTFGIRILANNLRRFQGALVPAIASYNADIKKVRQWMRRNGKMKQDEFIESIPYQETRLYVKKVLAGYRAYSNLHRKKDLAGYW